MVIVSLKVKEPEAKRMGLLQVDASFRIKGFIM